MHGLHLIRLFQQQGHRRAQQKESLELQISSDGSTFFPNVSSVAIAQVNQTSLTNLLPVSTADLSTFVYAPSTVSDMATNFEPIGK